jgi:hypothetical protein
VLDLNGFGGGTGNPSYGGVLQPMIKGNSNFPNNPNVAINGAQLIPPLAPGTCTFNGGSSGPFTFTKDSSLRDFVATAPEVQSVTDMAIGHALDNTFNNEQPFGCQAGGGNICAQSGLKRTSIIPGGAFTVASANVANVAPLKTDFGVENLASWAPHPNPPPLTYPPLCLSPLINALEPTAIDSTYPIPITALQAFGPPFPPRFGPQLRNLLGPGPNPLGIPPFIPPQSTLASEQNSFFEGPATPQPKHRPVLALHDAPAGRPVPVRGRPRGGRGRGLQTPTASSCSIASACRIRPRWRCRRTSTSWRSRTRGADQVTFIDINPSSATFHQIIKTTTVGTGPTGICWDSANEDIFVCNQAEGTVSVISGFTLDVRKTLRNQITRPIDVALTPRQTAFGFLRGVYFGYILNQNGNVAIFESGPDGINGFGFDDVISSLPFKFQRPKTLQVDPTNLNSAVWIAHEFPLDEQGNPTGQNGGALSNVGITGGIIGIIPLDPGIFTSPQIRELSFSVLSSIGEGPGGLSGIPIDLAFDNLRNLSALTNYTTTFSPGNALNYNGKSLVRILGGFGLQATAPQFLFAAVPNPGVIDVYDMTSGSVARKDTDPYVDGIQAIPAPNVDMLMDYFRQ